MSVVHRASVELVGMWEVVLVAHLLLQGQALVPSSLFFAIAIERRSSLGVHWVQPWLVLIAVLLLGLARTLEVVEFRV